MSYNISVEEILGNDLSSKAELAHLLDNGTVSLTFLPQNRPNAPRYASLEDLIAIVSYRHLMKLNLGEREVCNAMGAICEALDFSCENHLQYGNLDYSLIDFFIRKIKNMAYTMPVDSFLTHPAVLEACCSIVTEALHYEEFPSSQDTLISG